MPEKVLLRHLEVPNLRRIDVYESDGGYAAARRALTENQPAQLIELVKSSGLRGRGGAGFPTGVKWGFLPKDSPAPRYLCVNADESEPGTFKDRQIIEDNPHLLIEGIIISAYAIQSHVAYIYYGDLIADGTPDTLRELPEVNPAGARRIEITAPEITRALRLAREMAGIRSATIFGQSIHALVDEKFSDAELRARAEATRFLPFRNDVQRKLRVDSRDVLQQIFRCGVQIDTHPVDA